MANLCEHCEETKKIKLGKNLKIFGIIFILFFAASFLPALSSLNESLLSYLKIIWWAVLLGLVLGGMIDYFIPEKTWKTKKVE